MVSSEQMIVQCWLGFVVVLLVVLLVVVDEIQFWWDDDFSSVRNKLSAEWS